jgi:hypothetical protein
MAALKKTNAWPEAGRWKTDVAALYGTSFVISFIVFFTCLARGISALKPLAEGSGAIDFAALSFGASVLVLSLGIMVINNFIFLGENKNWQNFWTVDMLEYFGNLALTERWRIARGRFILSFATLFSAFAICLCYGFIRSLST